MVYVGGKKKIAKFIVPFLQNELNSNKYSLYLEPFCGGLNIAENIIFDNILLCDINHYLIEFYKALQNGWKMPKPNSFNAEHYNEVRTSFKNKDKKYPDYYYGYMMFVPSYNGKMWGSFAKDSSRLYQKEHYDSVNKQINFINKVNFSCNTYENLNVENAVIYCDIPYKDSKKNYYDKNFDYENFYNWCRHMSKNNKIFISETQMPEDFKCIWQKDYKRTLANQSKGIQTTEKLFTI